MTKLHAVPDPIADAIAETKPPVRVAFPVPLQAELTAIGEKHKAACQAEQMGLIRGALLFAGVDMNKDVEAGPDEKGVWGYTVKAKP